MNRRKIRLRDADVIMPKFDGTWTHRTGERRQALLDLLDDTLRRLEKKA
jgi:hypothetical protein